MFECLDLNVSKRGKRSNRVPDAIRTHALELHVFYGALVMTFSTIKLKRKYLAYVHQCRRLILSVCVCEEIYVFAVCVSVCEFDR